MNDKDILRLSLEELYRMTIFDAIPNVIFYDGNGNQLTEKVALTEGYESLSLHMNKQENLSVFIGGYPQIDDPAPRIRLLTARASNAFAISAIAKKEARDVRMAGGGREEMEGIERTVDWLDMLLGDTTAELAEIREKLGF